MDWPLADSESIGRISKLVPQQINSSLVDQQLPLLLVVLSGMQTALGKIATRRAALQLEAHEQVREAMRAKAKLAIEPVLPVDILGAYLLLPLL